MAKKVKADGEGKTSPVEPKGLDKQGYATLIKDFSRIHKKGTKILLGEKQYQTLFNKGIVE